MTLILTTILIIDSCHLGRGGGVDSRRRVNFDNPGLENRISFFISSGLIVQLLTKEGISITYMSPPPVIYLCRGGGGVEGRSRHGQRRVVSWTCAMHDLGISTVHDFVMRSGILQYIYRCEP